VKIDHDKLVQEFATVEEVQPGRCDPEVYDEGQSFCCLAGPRSWMIEAWVKKIRELSGVKVDWNMSGGRAVVAYVGDQGAFKSLVKAADLTRPAFEEAARQKTTSNLVVEHGYPAIQWLNADNPWGAL
jgi:hypothetical protein